MIYAVTAVVELDQFPKWLEEIWNQYNQDVDEPHITLKQSAFVGEKDVARIKALIKSYLQENPVPRGKIEIEFGPVLDDPDKVTLMIAAEPNEELIKLQSSLVTLLKEYSNYRKPELAEYEANFQPHLTIGDDLTKEEYFSLVDQLSESKLRGKVRQLKLYHVPEQTLEAALNPDNFTLFNLKTSEK